MIKIKKKVFFENEKQKNKWTGQTTIPRAVRRLGEFEQIGSWAGRLEPEPIESVRSRYFAVSDTIFFSLRKHKTRCQGTKDSIDRNVFLLVQDR